MKLYDVKITARYCVESDNPLGAPLKALAVMRAEIIRCPENMGDFKTEVTLISKSA